MTQATMSRENGITILEVLIAMIVLSLSLLLLLNMAMVALDGNDWSNNTTTATQLLQEKLEQLRGDAAGVLESGCDTVQGIERSWSVTDLDSHLRQVDVQVVWEDIRLKTHTNSMSAFIRTDSV